MSSKSKSKSTKRKKTTATNVQRKSSRFNGPKFGERFCDDLSEVIVQYLPLKDKLRLECVSKQFQRVIYQKHNVLKVESILMKKNKIDLEAFEAVLKKLTAITSIDFFTTIHSKVASNAVIKLITTYCPHLNQLKNIDLSHLNPKIYRNFVAIFGTKLTTISVSTLSDKIVESFPNIEELYRSRFGSVLWRTELIRRFNFDLKDIVKYEFKKIKKLSVNYSDEDVPHLKTFTQNYKRLKHLSIITNNCDLKSIKQLLQQMLNFENLIHFEIIPSDRDELLMPFGDSDHYYGIGLNDLMFRKYLSDMSLKCTKLKSFGGVFVVDVDIFEDSDQLRDRQLFASLLPFKQLKRLNLQLRYDPDTEWYDATTEEEWFKFESLAAFGNITHLTLEFQEMQDIHENIMEYISTYVPNLEYFELFNELYSTKSMKWGYSHTNPILEALPYFLSELKKLKGLNLNIKESEIKKMRKTLKNQCQKLESISFVNEK